MSLNFPFPHSRSAEPVRERLGEGERGGERRRILSDVISRQRNWAARPAIIAHGRDSMTKGLVMQVFRQTSIHFAPNLLEDGVRQPKTNFSKQMTATGAWFVYPGGVERPVT